MGDSGFADWFVSVHRLGVYARLCVRFELDEEKKEEKTDTAYKVTTAVYSDDSTEIRNRLPLHARLLQPFTRDYEGDGGAASTGQPADG